MDAGGIGNENVATKTVKTRYFSDVDASVIHALLFATGDLSGDVTAKTLILARRVASF
jgi:hypothetical protein